MASNSISTNPLVVITNPYKTSRNTATHQLRREQLELQTTNQVAAATMGIQTQRREGAVKKCKKRATALI
jgi:hypothetical protein